MSKQVDIACIIDDDYIYTFSLKKLMDINNFCKNLMVFKNGEDALKYMKPMISSDAFPDVILLDIDMPVMDGWEFLDEFVKIKPALNKRVTIYMISSSIHEADIQRANQYEDVTDYIVKPITLERLKKIFGQ